MAVNRLEREVPSPTDEHMAEGEDAALELAAARGVDAEAPRGARAVHQARAGATGGEHASLLCSKNNFLVSRWALSTCARANKQTGVRER